MKRLVSFLSVLFCLFMTGCTEKENTLMYDGDDKLLFTYEGGVQNITFVASEIWTASVTNTGTTTEQNWVTIDTNSGNAGENAIEINVKENSGETDRTASLAVFCGGDVLTIEIVQNPESGEVVPPTPVEPKMVSSVTVTTSDDCKEIYNFEYDAEKVSKMIVTVVEDGVEIGKPDVYCLFCGKKTMCCWI